MGRFPASPQTTSAGVSAERVWEALDELPDPEIPVISLVELGVVREIAISEDRVSVDFAPTFMGCPALDVMVRAIRERGVKITIVTPGRHSDHLLTRTSSRRLYGPLLKAGAQVFEYKPAMMHAKVMIVDGLWSVVGSTNFDNRSFGLNDEVNLAACDQQLAARLQMDFALDLADSEAISYDDWKRRSLFDRAHEWLGWMLERQQ